MSASLTTKLTLVANSTKVNTLDLGTVSDAVAWTLSDSLANGTGNDQANVVWHDSRALATTSETLDLSGTLTDGFGATVAFTKIKGIIIHNTGTTTGDLITVGGAAANQFVAPFNSTGDKVKVGPNGILLFWSPMDGYAVAAGSTDNLKIEANAALTYEIWIVGVGT